MAVAAILAEGDFGHEEIANLIDAIGLHHRHGIDDIAQGFGHFLAAVEQKPVGENPLGQGDTGGHQERRPVNGVKTHDILADDVNVGRPEFLEFIGVFVREPHAGNVVGQGIDPDIHHMGVVAGHLDPPIESGARDRQIPKAPLHEAHHFVAAALRADEIGIGAVVVE